MISLEIKYGNGTSFKEVHDMIMDCSPNEIVFIEDERNENDEDPNVPFRLAHYIRNFHYCDLNNVKLVYQTYKTEFPMDLLDPEIVFRGTPFDIVILNGKKYTFDEEY